MKPVIELSLTDVGLAAAFLLLPAILSLRQNLGIHRDLLVGGLRCFAQLSITGFLLKALFQTDAWYWVVLALGVMTIAGGHTAASRQKTRVPGLFGLSTLSIFVTAALTLAYATQVIVRVSPWYDPQYLIPLAGMILGNAMNGSALAAERLGGELRLRRQEIEVLLALGATPRQACAEAVRATIRASLIPAVNGLMSVGLVHLPGMMTGQMLGGAPPTTAVRYQILIFYALTFVSATTAILMTSLLHRRYFTDRMQLRGEYVL